MASMSNGSEAKVGSALGDADQRRREMVLLLILASVQFTSIVDFMVVMPLGPQLMRKLDIDAAQFGWIVASYTVAAGLAGLLASSIMDRFGRKSAFLTLYAGFLLGTLFCGLSTGYYMLLVGPGAHGRFRRNSGGPGAGDHRRRFPGRTARACDRDLDVGLRGRVGRRRARRHLPGGRAGLARPIPGSGRSGPAGVDHRPARLAAACATTCIKRSHSHPWRTAHRNLQPFESPACLRSDRRGHAGQFFGDSVHQSVTSCRMSAWTRRWACPGCSSRAEF